MIKFLFDGIYIYPSGGDPVAAAVLADEDDCRRRTARWRFDELHVSVPSGGEPWRLIAYYGVIIMLGAVAGAWLATREVKRRGGDPEVVWDLLVYLIIGGVVGARLWHVFTPPPSSIEQGYTTAFY